MKVELSIHDDWLNWMTKKHIPEVMDTGYFVSYNLFRIIEDNEVEGISYAIQYFANSFSDYMNYQQNEASRLQKEHSERYEGKFVAFRTILRLIDHSE